MQAEKSFLCTFCAIVCCILHCTEATREVFDVDSGDLNWKNTYNLEKKEWNSFGSYSTLNQVHPMNWRKKIMKTTSSKDLTNKDLRRKFIEVMPVLKDLTDKQILALRTLMSTQINSKPGHEHKFGKKVTHMLNLDKTTVLSLTHHIPNLEENSANGLSINTIPGALKASLPSRGRTVQLTPAEINMANKNIGVEDQVIDPRFINEELMRDFKFYPIKLSDSTRKKRSAAKLVHKLIRIPPLKLPEEVPVKEIIPLDMKLNTSSFAGPYYKSESIYPDINNDTVLSYEQIEDLALGDLNGTEIELNGNNTDGEHLPSPEELVAGPRYRIPNKHRVSFVKGDLKRKRMPIRSHQIPLLQKKCERFTASMCIKADDYPLEQIMGSIRRHKNAMSALLAEYHDKAAELEYQEQLEEYQFNSKRREDGNVITPGGMCASIVRYARPQKARSASGEWKYIVNTGRHTQTLRLEKCSTPQESCSYLSHNYRSRCTQVYNYHRLLSWDKTRGLHVDIFKVPTCCSCQVDGYRETFPPLGGTKHKEYKDYTPVPNNNPYLTVNDEIDYEDEDEEDSPVAYQYSNALKKNKFDNYQHSELVLGSTNIKTKVNPPRLNPTVGSYLSPPSNNYDSQPSSKNSRPTYYTNTNNLLSGNSRKPFKNYTPNEPRVDLEISGTEQSDKEMKPYSINGSTRIHQKRTRLYSGSSNLETPYQTMGPLISLESVPSYIPTTEITTTLSHMGNAPSTVGSNTRKEVGNGKRINYNYHPIIDFFESHQKAGKGQLSVRTTATNSIPVSTETITLRDRRIGYGIGGLENNWHPVMVNS